LLELLFFRAYGDGDPVEAARIVALAEKKNLPAGVVTEQIGWCTRPEISKLSSSIDAELKRWDDESGEPITGLIEAYSNGEKGYKRDGKRAFAIACRGVGVPAELESILNALHASRDLPALESAFRFCDHVTSGWHQGECANSQLEASSAAVGRSIDGITSRWPKAEKSAFEKLKAAADRYFSRRASAEQDLSGSARVSMEAGMVEDQEKEFLQQVKDFAESKIPADTDFPGADRALNDIYSKVIRSTKFPDYATFSKDDIRESQRLWIPYRDAWVALGKVRYPKVSAAAWQTWLTRLRVRQLEEFQENYLN
jgi:uncharacterized protein YecT (DUF1311 family)